MYPPETATLFGHITGFFSFTFGADGVERTYTKALAGRIDDLAARRLRRLAAGPTAHRQRAAHPPGVGAAGRPRRARRAQGRGRRPRPPHRRGARDVELPVLRPQPAQRPRPRVACSTTASSCSPTPDKPLLARAYRERYFPGIDVQGRHRGGRPRDGPRDAGRTGVPDPARARPAADRPQPAQLRRVAVRRQPHPGPPGVVQHRRSRRSASTSAPTSSRPAPRPSASAIRPPLDLPRRAAPRRSPSPTTSSATCPRSRRPPSGRTT